MRTDPKALVQAVLKLHRETVARWHETDPDNPYENLLAVVCQQHQFNYLLWHEEDVARSPDASDTQIAMVKRAIDGFNQRRNDWIERIDEELLELLDAAGVRPNADARLNTETPGGAVDRLSIMALRIYHLEEQLERVDVDEAHFAKVRERLARCRMQQSDLAGSLTELIEDLFAGRKRLKVYRQMKMYNDATMNPYLYRRSTQRVA
jgi:hypothetical protein